MYSFVQQVLLNDFATDAHAILISNKWLNNIINFSSLLAQNITIVWNSVLMVDR